ncbi:MAG TPA: rhodanese-like domain-containing protein [Candidatus Acidoferrum sp.]|nr:rhodanese-like domain-containing protein [Candidatus Acidoferrum sp.]
MVVLTCTLVSSVLTVSASACTNINVGTAYSMITGGAYPNLVILDVRTKSEYDSGHIYGALLIPVANLSARISELLKYVNDPMIVYVGQAVEAQSPARLSFQMVLRMSTT